ncbi:MAG: sigma-70 family RNA polymerase sigma factor [Paramuribaculum sp.]|nr:sigma-70 family RNA polymerase sigma factor [Paramuribaculum sp.]
MMRKFSEKEKRFVQLIDEHSRLINQICYFYSTLNHPFEDLRQEVYISIWKGLDKFRGDSKISTFIYRIAVNSVLMVLRSGKTKIETTPLHQLDPELLSTFDDEQKEKLDCMYQMINSLDEIEKPIILLWLDGKPYEEIAEIVGFNRNTVATRISRIKKKLSKLA